MVPIAMEMIGTVAMGEKIRWSRPMAPPKGFWRPEPPAGEVSRPHPALHSQREPLTLSRKALAGLWIGAGKNIGGPGLRGRPDLALG